MEKLLNSKHFMEIAELVFVRITDTIFKVEKDRKGIYSGRLYVTDKEVVDSLNQYKTLIYKDDHRLNSHRNF